MSGVGGVTLGDMASPTQMQSTMTRLHPSTNHIIGKRITKECFHNNIEMDKCSFISEAKTNNWRRNLTINNAILALVNHLVMTPPQSCSQRRCPHEVILKEGVLRCHSSNICIHLVASIISLV
jgi:hypothetical protein